MSTSKLSRSFARLRLFIQVILHGCRIVSVETLECEKCRYASICEGGYFTSVERKTPVVVLVKEVHVRPQRDGRFQDIADTAQTDLQFEVFANCWLVGEASIPVAITELQLTLRKAEGSTVGMERVSGDLQNWRLRRLKENLDSEGLRYLQAAQEEMPELDITEALQGGVARAGWLHCRLQNITPAEFKAASVELTVKDSLGHVHLGVASGLHHMPGRVWPFTRASAQAGG